MEQYYLNLEAITTFETINKNNPVVLNTFQQMLIEVTGGCESDLTTNTLKKMGVLVKKGKKSKDKKHLNS